jgi:hypothetical protein
MAPQNLPLVHRTWGLKQQDSEEVAYGENFTYEEYQTMSSKSTTVVGSAVGLTVMWLFQYAPVRYPAFRETSAKTWLQMRWLVRKVAPAPGDGPSDE